MRLTTTTEHPFTLTDFEGRTPRPDSVQPSWRNHLRVCRHQRVTRFLTPPKGNDPTVAVVTGYDASATLTHKKVHVARRPFGDSGLTTGMSNTPRRPQVVR
jgi:hypothetical protein